MNGVKNFTKQKKKTDFYIFIKHFFHKKKKRTNKNEMIVRL